MMIYWKGNVSEHFTLSEYAGTGNGAAIMTMDSMLCVQMAEEFRVWLKRPMIIHAWHRTAEENKKVGGIANSNHLRGCAFDFHTNIEITEAKFKKYAKKWKSICAKHGVVGEAGLYNGWIHFGVQNEAQVKANKGKFFNWDSRSGKQKNGAFAI